MQEGCLEGRCIGLPCVSGDGLYMSSGNRHGRK